MLYRRIESLDDLVSALADEARETELSEFPEHAKPPKPGIDEATARLLGAEFDLDPSYLAVAQRTDLTQLEIGYIWGSPGMSPTSPLTDQLREARDNLGIADWLAERSLVCVGDICGDTVAVGTMRSPYPGRVFGADFEGGDEIELYPLAPDFAAFLLAAGRLHYSVKWRQDDDVAEAPAGLLSGLGFSGAEMASWVNVASMMGVELPR